MLTRLITILLFVSSMPLLRAETGRVIELTPRASDTTAARACGQDLEAVKAAHGFTRRIELHGGEYMTAMQFCKNGRLQISPSRYHIVVPAGEVVAFWTDNEGKHGVIEGCVNLADLEIPIPKPQPPVITLNPLKPELPLIPSFDVTWHPLQPSTPRRPDIPVDKCQCVAIMSNYFLEEFGPNAPALELWVATLGELKDGEWLVDGQTFMTGLHIRFTAQELYDFVHGKPGLHQIRFRGHGMDGTLVDCGVELPINLVKKGRRWWWKLPILHCVYTFTHDIKKWKGWPLAEKIGFCPAEAAAVWWFAEGHSIIEVAKAIKPGEPVIHK